MMGKLLILFVLLGVMPLCVGGLWIRRADNFVGVYLYGLMTLLALHQLIAIPLCFRKASLHLMVRLFGGGAVFLAVAGICRAALFLASGKSFRVSHATNPPGDAQGRVLRTLDHKASGEAEGAPRALRIKVTPLLAVTLLCVLLQAAYVTRMQHVDADDAYYLATAVTAVEKDGLYTYNPNTGRVMKETGYVRYMLASWPIFIAVLSQVSGMHATVIAHSVLPAVVVVWCYLAFFLLAGWLYPKEEKRRDLFMLFVAVLFTFGGFSIYSSMVFPLIRGWQGKAVLAGMGFPLLTFQVLKVCGSKEPEKEPFWSADWTLLFLIAGGISAFSTIADIFGCVIVGSAALIGAVTKKQAGMLIKGAVSCGPFLVLAGIYMLRMKGFI